MVCVIESLVGYPEHEKISDASEPGKNASRCARPRRVIVVAFLLHLTYTGRLLCRLITIHKLSTSLILRRPIVVIDCCLKSHIVSFETENSRRSASQTFASLASIPGRVCQIVVSICPDEVGDLHHR